LASDSGDDFRGGRTSLLLPPGAENPSYATGGRSIGAKISRGRGCPPANILIPLEMQLIVLQLAADSFYIMKLFQQTFRPLFVEIFQKDDKIRYFIPMLRKSGEA